MGKIQILTKEQQIILDEVANNVFLRSHFYLTGGTALAAFYLNHRYSDDLDFFSKQRFDNEVILTLISELSQKYHFTFTSRFVEVVYIFQLTFANKSILKLDFAVYPYKKLEEEQNINGVHVDSLTDIAVNKLFVISQRNDVKDFVDLYFLLQQFNMWDLFHGVKLKFNQEVEPMFLSADFLKVEDFEYLPKMVKPKH